MAPQTPLLLVDNIFDQVNLYPGGAIAVSSEITGREGFRVADARRERSWWQPANDGGGSPGNWIAASLPGGATIQPDFIWIDRGHNLWGHLLEVSSSPTIGGAQTTRFSRVVPVLGTVGGDPTTGWCVTEEGAIYALANFVAPANSWRVNPPFASGLVYIIPGLMLGKRTQLLGFSRVKDEDAATRTEIQEVSRANYLGTDKRYAARTVTLDLAYIGATEYDGTIRTLRRQLFELDQPAVVCMDYGTHPERAWLYRYQGTQFSAPQTRVSRATQFTMREVGPLLR